MRLGLFVAFGTRGDVQPLACLAKHLQHSEQSLSVELITHVVHQEWLSEGFRGLQHRPVATLPARSWGRQQHTFHHDQFGGFEQHLETLTAIHAAIHQYDTSTQSRGASTFSQRCPSSPGGSSPAGTPPTRVTLTPGTSVLIVFNLFALECFHITEALGPAATCVAAAPYLIPYSCPMRFQHDFSRVMPQLFAALHQDTQPAAPAASTAGDAHGGGTTGQTQQQGSVTWSEVQHWLWPLFTQRWDVLRQHLGLPLRPYHAHPSPSGALQPPSGALQPVRPLSRPPPLLYGFSPLFVPRPSYWPRSVHICGFWTPSACCGTADVQLSEGLQALLSSLCRDSNSAQGCAEVAGPGSNVTGPRVHQTGDHTCKPGCIDFGSMGRLGLLPSPGRLLAILANALQQLGMRALLLTGGWEAMEEAHNKLAPDLQQRLVRYTKPAPHAALLPHVSFLMHPGGSGSTAAALLAGVPQITLPLHFDQFFHAERLEYLGLSPPALRAADLLGPHPPGQNTVVETSQDQVQQEAQPEQRGTGSKRRRLDEAVAPDAASQPPGASKVDVPVSVEQAVQTVISAVQAAMRCAPACRDFTRELQREHGLDAGVALLKQQIG